MEEKKIYLDQIAKYVGKLHKNRQTITLINRYCQGIKIRTENNDYEPMVLIHDSDLIIKSVDIKSNGMLINGKADASQVRVFLWDNDTEVQQDRHGKYIDYTGALNGILLIDHECINEFQADQLTNIPF